MWGGPNGNWQPPANERRDERASDRHRLRLSISRRPQLFCSRPERCARLIGGSLAKSAKIAKSAPSPPDARAGLEPGFARWVVPGFKGILPTPPSLTVVNDPSGE